MTQITIPVTAAQNGGALYTLVDDLTNLNSEVSRTRDGSGDNLIIDDSGASSEQKLEIDQANILAILAAGGEIENYLFGIRQPLASGSLDVPVGVPSRLFILGAVREFSQWFSSNADVWRNNVTSEFMYYISPNPSDGLILKASEAEIIRQIDTGNYSFMTVAEVQAIVNPEGVPDPDWTKL